MLLCPPRCASGSEPGKPAVNDFTMLHEDFGVEIERKLIIVVIKLDKRFRRICLRCELPTRRRQPLLARLPSLATSIAGLLLLFDYGWEGPALPDLGSHSG